jgi:hypothetical protein
MRAASRLMAGVALAALGGIATIVAQGSQGATQPVGGTQPVGSLTIPSLSIADSPIYGFGFSLKASFADSGSGGTTGKTEFSTIDLVRTPDSASTALLATAAKGLHVPEVQIVVEASTAGGPDSLYRLGDVVITRLANDNGVEQVSIAYGRIELHAGSGNFCFEIDLNKSC